MKLSTIPMTGTRGKTGRATVDERSAAVAAMTREIPAAQAWFAGGERTG